MIAGHYDVNDVTKSANVEHYNCMPRQAAEASCKHSFLANVLEFVHRNEISSYFFCCKPCLQPISHPLNTLEPSN